MAKRYIGGGVAGLGVIICIIGSVVTWFVAETALRTWTMGGLEAKGGYTLAATVAALIGLLILVMAKDTRLGQLLTCLAAAGILIFSIYGLVDMPKLYLETASSSSSISPSAGIGIYLCITGSIIIFAGAIGADIKVGYRS